MPSRLLAVGFAFSLLQKGHHPQSAPHHPRLRSGSPTHESHSEVRKGYVSVAMYLVAIPLAFWHPYVALLDHRVRHRHLDHPHLRPQAGTRS